MLKQIHLLLFFAPLVLENSHAARKTEFNQVFFLANANTSSDVTVKNLSKITQTVCVNGGVYQRLAGSISSPGSPVCSVYVLNLQTGASLRTISGESNCVELSPATMANWNVRRSQNDPNACSNLGAGIVNLELKVLEDRGAVAGSVLINQINNSTSTQAFVPINGGRPF